jgi:hypothetical protein
MTRLSYPHRLASQLLRAALSIAPHDMFDWGQGMLSELHHVEGNWSALLWAFGGAGVLVKRAVLAAIFTGSNRAVLPSGGDLFEKETPMRKTVLITITACVAASLLFFAAPVFRQAFRVSLAQWHDVLHVKLRFGYPELSPELDALAKKAEQNHDAEALAFVAVRYPNEMQSAHFADEAVHLDPNLTWIYATAGTWDSPSSGTDRVSALKQWDPQNALPYLFEAQKIGVTVSHSKEFPLGKVDPNPGWEQAMEAAFQSPKLDSYAERQKQLDHRVISRYRLDDPFQLVSDDNWYGFPSFGVSYCDRYAQSLLESGRSFESRGDRKAAFERYWSVARFGQMMSGKGQYMFFVSRDMKQAYTRLGALSQAEGNNAAAAFYASLANQVDNDMEEERALLRKRARGSDVSHWNAFLVRLSGLAMLFCAALLLFCVVGVIVRNRSLKLGSLHPSRLTLALGSGAAVGALLSSAILFVSYRPYSELVQRFLTKGDNSQLPELYAFLRDTQLPLGSQFNLGPGSWYVASWNIVFYFWFAVTIVCALVLLIAVFRHFQTRPRTHAPA